MVEWEGIILISDCIADSSFVPPLIYAFMGAHGISLLGRWLWSLLLGTLLQNEIDPSENPVDTYALHSRYILCWLGFLIDFLSHAAIVGFMAGAAITIALQQLKGLLGIKTWSAAHHVNVLLAFLLVAKYIGKRRRNIWVPAIAPLISVVLSTFFVYITRADKHGGESNPSSLNEYFSLRISAKGFRIGVLAGMIALTEAVAIGRTFASMKDYQLDGNKEMVALGTMNVVSSMTSCYVATGSFSRSAVNYMAGCNTAASNIVMSSVYTPNAILASIIISAVISLVDIEAMTLIWKIDKFDFVACMGAFFGVVFSSVEIGLLIAVSISFAKILLQVTRPRTAVLGKIPRTTVYRNILQYPAATKVPGILIVRVDSAIYFSNSNYVKERWLADEEEQLKETVTDIDTSGIHAMEELFRSLEKRDVKLVLANPGPVVVDKLHASKFHEMIGEDRIFLTVEDAIVTCAPKMDLEP
ncbi:hypothetical protein V6Z11_1Z001900 [Gossypium hirsutum]